MLIVKPEVFNVELNDVKIYSPKGNQIISSYYVSITFFMPIDNLNFVRKAQSNSFT